MAEWILIVIQVKTNELKVRVTLCRFTTLLLLLNYMSGTSSAIQLTTSSHHHRRVLFQSNYLQFPLTTTINQPPEEAQEQNENVGFWGASTYLP